MPWFWVRIPAAPLACGARVVKHGRCVGIVCLVASHFPCFVWHSIIRSPIATPQPSQLSPGRSSAWLERQLWELEVAGSNPVAPNFFQKQAFGENFGGLSHS